MPTDTKVDNLVINLLSQSQYDSIQNPAETEMYLVPDVTDTAPTQGSSNPVESGGVYTSLSGKQDTIDSSHKLSADLIEDGTTNKVINVKPDWNAASGTAAEILNKPTIPDAVSGTNDGTNWTTITIGNVTKNIPSGGGGGLSDHDFTHTANTTVSTSTTTVTFAANTRGSAMLTISADLGLTIACNNGSDNYIWVKNTGSSDVDITVSAVTQNSTNVSNVYVPSDGITVPAGGLCEIGIIVNTDGAFITSRNDLAL